MRYILDRLLLIVKLSFGLIVFSLFALLIGLMFLAGPVAILAETYDLLTFDSEASGQVTQLDIVHGSKGTSGISVEYSFVADAKVVLSKQLYPGFAANYGTYTGGSSLSQNYPIGAKVRVFYSAADPTRSCLEHGWHKWSIGWTSGIWGMVGYITIRIRKSRNSIVGVTAMLYGFGLIAIGPHTVLVDQLSWHILACMAIAAMVATYSYFSPNAPEPHVEHEPGALETSV
ncbi:MAG: DUF3592 domain-containing protein [Pirellulales bacterium]